MLSVPHMFVGHGIDGWPNCISLFKAIVAQGVVIIPHLSQNAFIKVKCTISLQMLVRGLQKVNIPCHFGSIWYEMN